MLFGDVGYVDFFWVVCWFCGGGLVEDCLVLG